MIRTYRLLFRGSKAEPGRERADVYWLGLGMAAGVWGLRTAHLGL